MTAAVTVAMVGVIVVALGLVVVLAREPGPSPAEVVEAYELAWDRLDFDALWSLSGSELRDDRAKREFIAAKTAAYQQEAGLRGLVRRVIVERVATHDEHAEACTQVELGDGSTVRNRLELAARDGRWVVVAYALLVAPGATPSPANGQANGQANGRGPVG